jgi:hypothetical protein
MERQPLSSSRLCIRLPKHSGSKVIAHSYEKSDYASPNYEDFGLAIIAYPVKKLAERIEIEK